MDEYAGPGQHRLRHPAECPRRHEHRHELAAITGTNKQFFAVTTFENAPIVVTNNTDHDPGSLRAAIATALAAPGADTITFAAALSGQTIALTTSAGGSAITVDDTVTIDASALAAGITIDGGLGGYRLF